MDIILGVILLNVMAPLKVILHEIPFEWKQVDATLMGPFFKGLYYKMYYPGNLPLWKISCVFFHWQPITFLPYI